MCLLYIIFKYTRSIEQLILTTNNNSDIIKKKNKRTTQKGENIMYNVTRATTQTMPAVVPQKAFSGDFFNRFIKYTDVKETTLQGYTVCLKAFAKYLLANGIKEPCREDIKNYKAYLDSTDYKAGTKQQYLRAVKHFFKWTSAENLYPNIADNIKGVKVRQDNTRKDALSEEDIKTICSSIDRSTETGKRDYLIILLSVTAGLRIIEMQRANIEDIKTIAGEKVLFIQGKGRDEKDEYKKITPEVWSALTDYLASRGNPDKKQPLFTGTSNRAKEQRITEPSISRIIKGIFRSAGYDSDRITAHSLRHTSVTLLLKSGATIQEAQQHARHADPATTGIYAHNLDRAKQHPEQRIYNQIFNPDSTELLDEANKLLQNMSEKQLKEALNYLKRR